MVPTTQRDSLIQLDHALPSFVPAIFHNGLASVAKISPVSCQVHCPVHLRLLQRCLSHVPHLPRCMCLHCLRHSLALKVQLPPTQRNLTQKLSLTTAGYYDTLMAIMAAMKKMNQMNMMIEYKLIPHLVRGSIIWNKMEVWLVISEVSIRLVKGITSSLIVLLTVALTQNIFD